MDRLLDAAPCGFLSFDGEGRVLAANRTLLDLLGFESESDLAGRHAETIFSLPTRIFFQTHFFPLLKLHGQVEEIYLTLRTRGGEDVPVLTNAARQAAEARFDCVFMRIRNRQKFEDELLRAKKAAEAANREKAAFLSILSHDLRTPLGAIAGYADIMQLELHGPVTEEQREDLRRIRAAGDFLLSMIEQLLHYSQLEAGQAQVRTAPVVLEHVLEQSEAIVELRWAEAELMYERIACDASLTVRADAERFQQILLNLLTNAIKFTPRGGRITVACQKAGELVRIAVADTGRGMVEEHLERIFEPFVQVDPDAAHKGVGLGLAISRQLARAMGGDLVAESRVGEGSTFVLTLPAVGAEPASVSAAANTPAGSGSD